MRVALTSLLLATAMGLSSAAYAAAPPNPAKPAAQAGATADHATMHHTAKGHGATGHGTMGHGMMDMAAMHCMGLSEQRLAAARTELKITDAQTPQWNAFVEAEKSSAAAMGPGMMQGAGHDHGAQSGSGMMMAGPLPERLERLETMMTAHLEALHKVRGAASPLYEALTPDQKAKADRLLCGQMGDHMGDHHMGGQMGDHGHKPAADGHAHPHRPQ